MGDEKGKKNEGGILWALQAEIFPRGIREFGRASDTEDRIEWFLRHLKKRLYALASNTGPITNEALCRWETVSDDCKQWVCYDEFGREISRGPVMCYPHG